MNWGRLVMGGFLATITLTTIMAGSQGLRLTRMSMPYLLGTMLTPNRDRAKVYGIAMHQVNGWIFALIYFSIFHFLHLATWWFGALMGLLHSLMLLLVLLPAFPGFHRRMASAQSGPTVVRQLEPPGFLGLHYGGRTPISVMVAHVIFGAILGWAASIS